MTNWIMVPVPAELEAPVLERVLAYGMRSSSRPAWSRDRLAAHLEMLSPDARAFARAVAQHMRAGGPPEDAVLAQQLGLSVREVLGLAQEVNDVTSEPFPGVLITVRYEAREGGAAGYRRLLFMSPLIAAALREHTDDADPPGDDVVTDPSPEPDDR
jgi:hypothetical protein